MMLNGIKRRADDILFSKYIRTRNKWTCQYCLRRFQEGDKNLHCSHFYGRRRESVRFDEENCDVLCISCHRKMEENPALYTEWKLKILGQTRYDLLRLKANQYQKKNIISNLKDIKFRVTCMEQEKPHNRRSL